MSWGFWIGGSENLGGDVVCGTFDRFHNVGIQIWTWTGGRWLVKVKLKRKLFVSSKAPRDSAPNKVYR